MSDPVMMSVHMEHPGKKPILVANLEQLCEAINRFPNAYAFTVRILQNRKEVGRGLYPHTYPFYESDIAPFVFMVTESGTATGLSKKIDDRSIAVKTLHLLPLKVNTSEIGN